MTRRVYDLPPELHHRVLSYQTENGMASEVEAVRSLLDQALQSGDTVESLYVRLDDKYRTEKDVRRISAEILIPHRKVRSVALNDDGTICFSLINGEAGTWKGGRRG